MNGLRGWLVLAAWLLAMPVLAEEALQISEPWAVASGSKNAQVYLTVRNSGSEQERLIGASSPVASGAKLQTLVRLGSVSSLQTLKSIGLPAGGEQVLQPGYTRILLTGLKRPLVVGEQLPLTLQFEKAGQRQVQAEVRR